MATNSDGDSEECARYLEDMMEIARKEGVAAVMKIVRNEREGLRALVDEVHQMCEDALMNGENINTDNQQPDDDEMEFNEPPDYTQTSLRTGARAKIAGPITKKMADDKYYSPSAHFLRIGLGDFEVPEMKLRIECISGKEQGKVWMVEPTLQKSKVNQVKIGRSSGKNYRNYGISLRVDDEVSTHHASIFRCDSDFFYKDMNSSNGSWVLLTNKALTAIQFQPHKAYKIINGMQVRMGNHVLQFNF